MLSAGDIVVEYALGACGLLVSRLQQPKWESRTTEQSLQLPKKAVAFNPWVRYDSVSFRCAGKMDAMKGKMDTYINLQIFISFLFFKFKKMSMF